MRFHKDWHKLTLQRMIVLLHDELDSSPVILLCTGVRHLLILRALLVENQSDLLVPRHQDVRDDTVHVVSHNRGEAFCNRMAVSVSNLNETVYASGAHSCVTMYSILGVLVNGM